MALLRNREVELLGKTDGQDESPTYTVMYKDGSRENVRLSELQLTEEEHKNLSRSHGEVIMTNVSKVDNKRLQELRDGSDRQKIEQRQRTQSTQPVQVNKVLVDPTEVTEKVTPRPQAQTQTTRTQPQTPQARR